MTRSRQKKNRAYIVDGSEVKHMMKTIISAACCFCFFGCAQIYNTISDEKYGRDFSGIELYYGDFSGVDNQETIPSWMQKIATYEESDSIRSPKQIIETGKADCDGYALLFMNIMYVKYGIKTSICVVMSDRSIVKGGEANHAVVHIGDKYINAQSGSEYKGVIGYEYPFDYVFLIK